MSTGDELNEYERNLATRFRDALFDIADETADMPSLIDPIHPEYATVLWLAFPRRKRRQKKPVPVAIQTSLDL